MKSRAVRWLALWSLLLPFLATSAYGGSVNLGTAGSYAVLAGSTVTNTGSSVLTGNLGISPGCALTGFPPGSVSGTINACNAASGLAQRDLTTAYNQAMGLSPTATLTGKDLGGMVLTPGVYFFASSAQLTGTLTLNNMGNPNALFVFQIGSTLTTASSSSVIFTNGLDSNVFWQVGSSATLGTTTTFEGNILALTSITLNNGASIGCGSALAINGAVTLNNNVIGGGCGGGGSTVPEPGTMGLMGTGLVLLLGAARLRFRV
jgi:type VI secretion system secreted protein VgrG